MGLYVLRRFVLNLTLMYAVDRIGFYGSDWHPADAASRCESGVILIQLKENDFKSACFSNIRVLLREGRNHGLCFRVRLADCVSKSWNIAHRGSLFPRTRRCCN
jgi:hypothetical protein